MATLTDEVAGVEQRARSRKKTYDLVNLGNLGLEDGDSIPNRGFLGSVSHSGGLESLGSQLGKSDLFANAVGDSRQHPLIIIIN